MAPLVTAVAWLVPLSVRRALVPVPVTSSGCSFTSVEFGAASPVILLPGATRSGFTRPSNRVGPREL